MHVVTAEEMKKLELETIQQIHIPAILLMENAGRGVAEAVLREAKSSGSRWLVLAGKGNNGADGVVAARQLAEAGLEMSIIYAEEPDDYGSGEALLQRDIAQEWGIPFAAAGDAPVEWWHYDGIIDALLGTGSKGAPRRKYAELITEANESGLPIVSVDIPSGIDADTGEVYIPCIKAKQTISFAFYKRGLLQFPGAAQAGTIEICPIGIPAKLAVKHDIRTFRLDEFLLKQRLAVATNGTRTADAHKGSYGHVLLAAGSRSMSGAGLLSSKAALRGGCGLATWALPEQAARLMPGHLPELMLAALGGAGAAEWSGVQPEELLALAAGKDALVIGPGLGRWEADGSWLRSVWEGTACPLVVDADALNMLADAKDWTSWTQRQAPVILTPHPGEMARLAGISVSDVQRDRVSLARSFASQHGVTLVLKGAGTVVATPEGYVYLNTTGNPGMATGGSGDVLAGLIGSLLAQGFRAEQAAAFGVYSHGAAGDRAAAKRHSPGSLIAGDIIEEL
ncbi:NAD(P)H-hydrate dehydratase [Paenibacillus eucommiae]|uniref:Bifunctional NAD(P)H-hydrate repair enzyme n=1 Tax=Paenibacillus eucommiae TaxID=1355755 RepID=A0ABS4INE8_9BACL|nr:NAD(P)H-hydrate dehydratase [Paenibacillus eucommiae]MBP1989094.1 NAD(P)H-hydrate epimerase [Paenibacillus eucommiae]